MTLYIFDIDDTLIEGHINPTRPYDIVTLLPRRFEVLHKLIHEGHSIALCTNQGGVAFGKVSEADFWNKHKRLLELLVLPPDTPTAVCFSDVRSKDSRYNKPEEAARRKPSGAMLLELIIEHIARKYEQLGSLDVAEFKDVLYVGDRPEDEEAAKNAVIPFMWTSDFFGDYADPAI
jgi:D-glycero-D-manno-heptose 1,7-bisphosphate phosphatase